jgi:hypothetical protein
MPAMGGGGARAFEIIMQPVLRFRDGIVLARKIELLVKEARAPCQHGADIDRLTRQ